VLLIYALIKRFTRKKDTTMDKREFKVDGMMCNHCRANVENAIKSVEGVTDVTVDLASGTASVQGTASDEDIISVISERGYTAKRQ
jgi:copper chaperone CopZ